MEGWFSEAIRSTQALRQGGPIRHATAQVTPSQGYEAHAHDRGSRSMSSSMLPAPSPVGSPQAVESDATVSWHTHDFFRFPRVSSRRLNVLCRDYQAPFNLNRPRSPIAFAELGNCHVLLIRAGKLRCSMVRMQNENAASPCRIDTGDLEFAGSRSLARYHIPAIS